MAQIEADAARHGDHISVWYDDLRIGARGPVSQRATEFEQAGVDARRGRVRALYSLALDGLFQGIEQQELWLAEMEDLGVMVQVRHLPYPADVATRTLVRQQVDSVREYLSARKGEAIRANLLEAVRQGEWIGRMLSQWGLRYDHDTKALAFDPDTADKIRLVFEAFVGAGGVASRAAGVLNQMVRDGSPRATRTPWDTDWKSGLVLFQVRCPLYRRRIVYGETVFDAPDRVPEVVPAALVAEADALMAQRRPRYDAVSRAHRSTLPPVTYLGLLRCAACGNVMRSVNSCDAEHHADGRWVSWRCSKGYAGGGCAATFTVRQTRLDALVGEAVTSALTARIRSRASSRGRRGGDKADASTVPQDTDTLMALLSRAERTWKTHPDPVRDAPRRAFLLDEGITARVSISSRTAARTYNSTRPRPTGGPVTVTVEFPRLGLTGEGALSVTETEGAYRTSRKGRTAPRESGVAKAEVPTRPRPRKAGRNLPPAGCTE